MICAIKKLNIIIIIIIIKTICHTSDLIIIITRLELALVKLNSHAHRLRLENRIRKPKSKVNVIGLSCARSDWDIFGGVERRHR